MTRGGRKGVLRVAPVARKRSASSSGSLFIPENRKGKSQIRAGPRRRTVCEGLYLSAEPPAREVGAINPFFVGFPSRVREPRIPPPRLAPQEARWQDRRSSRIERS